MDWLKAGVCKGWAVPQTLGMTAGYQIACDRCQQITWTPGGSSLLDSLPDKGFMADTCPDCGSRLLVELAPDWGMHAWEYPDWLAEKVDPGALA